MKYSRDFRDKFLIIIAISFLLFDSVYSFLQYYSAPFDGDFAAICLPMDHYKSVMEDPFGFQLLQNGQPHSGSNRFFSHAAMYVWFNDVYDLIAPFFKYRTHALFFCSALFSLLIQLLITCMLALYVKSFVKGSWKIFLMAMVIITPFFQFESDFYAQIGLIDHAITYTFFYAFPMALLLLFYYPFFQRISNDAPLKLYEHLYCIPLLIMLPFCGAITAAVILMIHGLALFWVFIQWRNKKKTLFQKTFIVYFITMFLWSLYSFYIGTFNAEIEGHVPLLNRYKMLLNGVLHFITSTYAWILLLVFAGVNGCVVFPKSKRMFLVFLLILVFAILYILVLPMGGYKHYRPDIVRYDVLIPVTLLIILFNVTIAMEAFKLSKNHLKMKVILTVFWIIIAIIFSFNDQLHFNGNSCQKEVLLKIETTDEAEVLIPSDCILMTWELRTKPNTMHHVSEMLVKWKIAKRNIHLMNKSNE